MIKKLLTVASVALTVAASAQVGGRINNVINIAQISEISKSITYKATSSMPPGCDTITTAQNNSLTLNTAGSDTATPGCAPKAGYVYGTNCYGDKEKANFFPTATYSAIAQPSVSGVIVSFFKNVTRGTGGAPTTTVGMSLYNGTQAGGPTTAISQTTATMAQILAAQVGTNTVINYVFNFSTPVSVPGTGFLASVVVPSVGASGDTAVVYNSPASSVNYSWEKWNDNTWHSISSAWGTNGNIAVYPIVCGNLVFTGISKNLGLSKDVKIMPNPSTGLVNLTVALPSTQDLNVTVTNALGQVIVNNNYNSILVDVISLDLTNQSNGVYFVTVSNGQDKMVQRLILNK
jgi:hypothetical protein